MALNQDQLNPALITELQKTHRSISVKTKCYCCMPLDLGVVRHTTLLWQQLRLTPNNSENYLGCQSTKTRINAILFNVSIEVLT